MADARALCADYECWLGEHIPVDDRELKRKHEEMAADELRFLRGTYFLWLVRVAEHIPEALRFTGVPLIGDLHVENYGTWRDIDQVRRWGINDLDELASGSWVLDLLRLAVSAVIAPHIALDEDEICGTVLDTWRTAEPRVALDLREHGAGHLRHLVPEFVSPSTFYATLAEAPSASVPDVVAAAAAGVAEPGWNPTWHAHVAGTGSLGHPRVVGVGPASDGKQHAREAKQLGPITAVWVAVRAPNMPRPIAHLYKDVWSAVRGPAGATRVADWQVRDLAPDVVRIELGGLHAKDAGRLLRSMARAAVDVHGSDRTALSQARQDVLDEKDFAAMVRTMVKATKADWAAYR